jgi:acetyl-CoA carboxylase biotin carboxyl carrier protein
MTVTAADIEALTELFERSDWDTLQLEFDCFQLNLNKRSASAAATAGNHLTSSATSIHNPSDSDFAEPATPVSPQATTAPARENTAKLNIPQGLIAVRAPNLGTFYRSPKPGAPPYVEIGNEVEAKTEVCLLEVMKLFTSVVAGERGIVREILIVDGEMVEHGQPLILLEPKQ